MEYHRGERVTHVGTLPSMAADRYGAKTAFSFAGEDQSYAAFEQRTNRVANVLAEYLEPDERVGLYMPNTARFPAAQFGAVRMGAVPVPLNLRLDPDTLAYVVRDAGIDAMVAAGTLADEARELAERTGVELLFVPDAGDYAGVVDYAAATAAAADEFEPVERADDDVYVQLYTSGTTGRPRGVPLSHQTVLSAIENFSRGLPVEADDTLLLALPLCHLYANGMMGLFVYRGGSMVVGSEPEPAELLSAIDKHAVTMVAGVPSLYTTMHREYRESPDSDLSTLRTAVSSGAPLPDALRRRIEEDWDVRLVEAWGMTEVPAATLEPVYGVRKGAGCVGPPLPGVELRLVDPETRETKVALEEGEPSGTDFDDEGAVTGEIAVRGPVVFDGYHGHDDGDIFDDEGWFYTGDVARVDRDGYVWLVDRADDMIVTGGHNVYPVEVEDALYEHPDVAEAAVVAAPHEVKGEAPVAFVVPERGADPDEDDLRSFALERVAAYAHPRRVFFLEELPQSAAGKLPRYRLETEVETLLDGPLEPGDEQL